MGDGLHGPELAAGSAADRARAARDGPYGRWLNGPIWYHIGDDAIDPPPGRGEALPAHVLPHGRRVPRRPSEGRAAFAAATEITHEYLICHDDIMDGDTSRRDQPALWVRYGMAGDSMPARYQAAVSRGIKLGDTGIANGINAGDYMMAKAYEAVTSSHLSDARKAALCGTLTTTLVKTGEGQALDVNLRADAGFTVGKYFELATLKTGYYLIFGVVGSAQLAGLDEKSIAALWTLGGNVGVAFQMLDDVIDLTSGKGRLGRNGKPQLGNDIREGKPSALFAKTMEIASRKTNRGSSRYSRSGASAPPPRT